MIVCCALIVPMNPTEASAQGNKSKTTKIEHRKVHTYSSVRPYLAHALRDCRCHEISDSFDKRACKKGCSSYKKKMLKWASKNPVLHESLEFYVEEYSFRSRSFTLNHTDSLYPEVSFGRVNQDGIIMGKSRCESVDGELTSMVETKLQLKAKMKESKAKKSVFRGARSVNAVAILKGKTSSVTWCCGAYMRRDFAMDKAPCSSRGFKYGVKEIAIGLDPTVEPDQEEERDAKDDDDSEEESGAWQLGFKSPVVPIEFTLKLIGFQDVPGELDD